MTALVQRADARGIRTLTLDSPKNRNALSRALTEQLRAELEAAGKAEDVRAVVLSHTGNTFCSGADLTDPSPDPEGLAELMRTLIELPKPVVARIDGHARGGGLGLVGACDIAVGSVASRFAFSEVRLGLAPAVVSLSLLPRLDPRAASRYYLTGEVFDVAEAHRIGLLSDVHAEVDTVVESVCQALRRSAPQALAEAKRLVNADVRENFRMRAEEIVALSARLFASEEARAGTTAFLNRQEPPWVR